MRDQSVVTQTGTDPQENKPEHGFGDSLREFARDCLMAGVPFFVASGCEVSEPPSVTAQEFVAMKLTRTSDQNSGLLYVEGYAELINTEEKHGFVPLFSMNPLNPLNCRQHNEYTYKLHTTSDPTSPVAVTCHSREKYEPMQKIKVLVSSDVD